MSIIPQVMLQLHSVQVFCFVNASLGAAVTFSKCAADARATGKSVDLSTP